MVEGMEKALRGREQRAGEGSCWSRAPFSLTPQQPCEGHPPGQGEPPVLSLTAREGPGSAQAWGIGLASRWGCPTLGWGACGHLWAVPAGSAHQSAVSGAFPPLRGCCPPLPASSAGASRTGCTFPAPELWLLLLELPRTC